MTSLERLRAQARRMTLFAPTSLTDAIPKLGFVQADPIRAPARAQDLILRHRVTGYRAGDLERRFVRLGLEEDFLHAYGFMPGEVWRLLHPRFDPANAGTAYVPTRLAAEVLAFVQRRGPTHPSDLEEQFGRDLAVNGWGGSSKATTRALESLRHYGLLRVAKRRNGIRVYAPATPFPPTIDPIDPVERARRLVLLVAQILAPVPVVSLRGALALMARRNPDLGSLAPIMQAALRPGETALNQWMDQNAFVTWTRHDAPWQLEDKILRSGLSLPLNGKGNPNKAHRLVLSKARKEAKAAARQRWALPT